MAARPVRRIALLGSTVAALAVVAGAFAMIPAQVPQSITTVAAAPTAAASPDPSPLTQVDIVYQETPTAPPGPVITVHQVVKSAGENESDGND